MLAYNGRMATNPLISPPQNETELLQRAKQIAGLTLFELARQHQEQVPQELHHAKGWIGQLLEKALGATAGSLPEPDFQQLGIELKTLPIDRQGHPKESTYVCTVPLRDNHDLNWQQSWVRNKLKRVLWVPIESDKAIEIEDRHIGQAILWSPSEQQAAVLQQDWEEHMDKICTGRLAEISARDGQYLQIRPKAASSRSVIATHNEEGQLDLTLPRGFYLRSIFTQQILKQSFHQLAT